MVHMNMGQKYIVNLRHRIDIKITKSGARVDEDLFIKKKAIGSAVFCNSTVRTQNSKPRWYLLKIYYR